MLTTYRRALALPGAWQFSSSAFVARLPIAMDSLGIVLLISGSTGSYAQAGALAATFQVAASVGTLVTSRWMDQIGQARLLPWLACLHALGLLAFVASVQAGLGLPIQVGTAILAGLSQPAIGSMVRARWAHVATDEAELRGAFALESIIDEVIFTIGPLLTAALAFGVGLPAPLVVASVLTVAGAIALTVQRRTQPPAAGRRRQEPGQPRRRSALLAPGMALMAIGALGVGSVFGSYEVTVVAFTQAAGQSGASGLILGLWAVGSMAGGIAFGSRQWSLPLPRQVLVLTGLLTLVLLPAPFLTSLPALSISTVLGGVIIAPALIAIFSLTERLVPSAQLTEGLSWTNSGLSLGFAGGTAIGGILIDGHGTTWGFALTITSAALACLVAAIGQPVLRRAAAGQPAARPGVAWVDEPLPGPRPGGVVDDPSSTGKS